MNHIQLPIHLQNSYFILRHGQTAANLAGTYSGSSETPLTDTGILQARSVVLPVKPDIVIHSPLSRAKQTAHITTSQYTIDHIAEDARLAEKSGGEIEGMLFTEIATKYPLLWGTWETHELEHSLHSKFPNGESDFDVATRLKNLIDDLEQDHTGKTILLVAHSGVIHAARYLSGLDKQGIYLTPAPNCHIEPILWCG